MIIDLLFKLIRLAQLLYPNSNYRLKENDDHHLVFVVCLIKLSRTWNRFYLLKSDVFRRVLAFWNYRVFLSFSGLTLPALKVNQKFTVLLTEVKNRWFILLLLLFLLYLTLLPLYGFIVFYFDLFLGVIAIVDSL